MPALGCNVGQGSVCSACVYKGPRVWVVTPCPCRACWDSSPWLQLHVIVPPALLSQGETLVAGATLKVPSSWAMHAVDLKV